MKLIQLHGKFAVGGYQQTLVDDEWFDFLNRWRWKAKWNGAKNNVYAIRTQPGKDGVTRDIRMHRVILNYSGTLDTDHINQNSLDNRLSNLRVCSRSVNIRNMKRVMITFLCRGCENLIVEEVNKNVRKRKSFCTKRCRELFENRNRPSKARPKQNLICNHCESLFEASKLDQKFCSEPCRKKSKRIRQKALGALPPSQEAELMKEYCRNYRLKAKTRKVIC